MFDDVSIDEDEKVEMRPVMLVGKGENGSEQEVALLSADLIKQSLFLMGTRWADKTEPRIVLDVPSQLVHLLVRFGQLVVKHNAHPPLSTETLKRRYVPLPVKHLPPRLTAQNRAMHLPHIIGYSTELAEFLNIVAENPYCVYQCAVAAERLLWEPAQTAFLLKFGTILDGLSLPFAELIWPNEKESLVQSQQSLNAMLKLTDKFFHPPPLTNSKLLLPPTPILVTNTKKKRTAAKIGQKRKNTDIAKEQAVNNNKTTTPLPTDNTVFSKEIVNTDNITLAIKSLTQWHSDCN
jgi:hypothetical protein